MQTTGDRVLSALASYDVKGKGGRYRANSPLRPGSNSHGFRLTIGDDGEHGAWLDSVSGESGTLYMLAERLGVERTGAAQPGTSKREYSGLADYATAHGVPAGVYEAAGWVEDVYSGRRALVIPTEAGPRWRFLDGDKPAYLNPTGYAPCWYGLRRAVDMARLRNGPIFLCNGEASTVAAQYHGVAAACITTGSERTLPDNLLAELRAAWDGSIVVALDCDKTGKEAAPKLVAQLRNASYEAAAVNLGGSNGFDLADFVNLYESEAYAVLCELARDSKPAGTLLHRRDLRQLPRPEYLIEGHIMRRAINVLYGAPGIGKSFEAIDYAAQVSQAENVVYVAAEDAGSYDPRVAAWEVHSHKETPGLYFWPKAVNALDPGAVDAFVAEIAPVKPALVIFDTLAACILGGNDAEPQSMGAILSMCDRVRQHLGSAALLVHHTGKNGEYRGWSGLLGAADMFTRFEDRDGLRILTVEKNKNDKPIDPVRMRLLPVTTSLVNPKTGELITSCVLIPDDNFDAVRTPEMTAQQMRLMELVCLGIFEDKGISKETLSSATGVPANSLYHSLSVLYKKHYIVHGLGKSSNIFATDLGRERWLEQYRRRPAERPE